jgi:hypothetical protein
MLTTEIAAAPHVVLKARLWRGPLPVSTGRGDRNVAAEGREERTRPEGYNPRRE